MNDSIKRKKNLGMAIAVIFTAVFAIITGACPHESGRKIYLQNLSGTISILPDGDEINFGSTLEA
ncbi:MAG: hypothetical protein FWH41_10140, partial [Treponema sp.]|nr:hypothetical protein [Treponema sp.]